ncbi:MAG TPA: Gfo/Idh/MocA family oxidoreductase [Oscillospiraceae bacterium]|nr:Gfo/Idh/MocA family oxidoreductase [Oscillospiraceae bacterium]HPF55290.1 Gfo/Idh/MocA family oxidoreductase [Clostridiales bacterium]HPK34694.1 Gfo/Idh/MocA family oxidoreductase [Oscillospiraceae bacterium]HPR74542.1 Gfo/Idh/MocA family oxidoreductase [Oscillospiraceae bacterium]
MKIGIIGTGWVSAAHIGSLQKIEGVEISAVAGTSLEKAEKITAKTGGNPYGDYRQMLSKEKLDAVYILTPPHVHGEIELLCAKAVPAVFIEKPVANDLETALTVECAFEEAGTIAASGYLMRYCGSVGYVKNLFANSPDKPALLNARWVCPMPGPMWWRTRAQSGGQFTEQCTHLVDAALYMAGGITEVSAFAATGYMTEVPGYDVDDAFIVNAKFKNGAIGNFSTGCFAQDEIDIGMVISSKTTRCKFSSWDMGLEIDYGKGHKETIMPEPDLFLIQNTAFVNAVKSGDASGLRSTYHTAVETLKVTLAANQSAVIGKPVHL